MPSPRYTAAPMRTSRELAERAEKEFQKRPDRFRQSLVWLSFVACLGTIGWLAAAAAREGRAIYQAGPVSSPHRFFENNCEACHTTWGPVARVAHVVDPQAATTSVDDARCQSCHAGSPHYAGQNPPHDGLGCAACHREHRGDAALVTTSAACVDCHRDLSATLAKRQAAGGDAARRPPAASITSFAADHPEFSALAAPDRTPLFFNHAKHLLHEYDADGKLVKGVRNERGELEDLSNNCGACHQPDAEKRDMAPIRFEAHCARCHPLLFDNEHFRGEQVPHGVDAATVRGFLTEKYVARAAAAESPPADAVRPLPGRRLEQPLDASARRAASAQAAAAGARLLAPIAKTEDAARQAALRREQTLFGPEALGGCRLCHVVDVTPADATAADGEASPLADWRITPPGIPATWMGRSRFSHDSHRFVACAACHKNWKANPPTAVDASSDTGDVLLPPIAACRACHGARSAVRLADGAAALGFGVASQCLDCHDYHARGAEPMSGGWLLDLSAAGESGKDGG